MHKITPFIWFENGAKEAAEYYISVLGGKITNVATMDNTPSGTVEIISLDLMDQQFTFMSAGPFQKVNGAISFVISCETQEEIDKYWAALSAVPAAEQCGWCTDKFGLVWQITPSVLDTLLTDADPEKRERTTQAMLQMKKLDIQKLQDAHDGK